jgi:hypothetical protein
MITRDIAMINEAFNKLKDEEKIRKEKLNDEHSRKCTLTRH